MKKHITLPFFVTFCTLSLLTLLFSCEILRKTPSGPTAKRKSSSSVVRRPVSKTPVKKAATSSKPTYSKPGSSAASSARNTPQIVQVARTYSGTPYRSGGNDKSGIDCSGLICSVYSEIGVKVPRISWQQSEFGREINSLKDIREGDWLFFVPEAGKEGYVSHAGIVTEVRNAQEIFFIHASTSRGVREDNLFSTYFKGRFVKAMRPF